MFARGAKASQQQSVEINVDNPRSKSFVAVSAVATKENLRFDSAGILFLLLYTNRLALFSS